MGKVSNKKVVVANPNDSGHARTVMIVVVVALVLAVILAGVVIQTRKKAMVAQPDGTIPGTASITGYAEPAEFSQGKGLWFKAGKLLTNEEIQQEAEKGTKVLEYYFDYTCNICNDIDEILGKGKQLEDLVEGGKALVVMRPTLTHAAPFAHVANNLIYWTAQNHPEKTWKLAKDLSTYAMKTYKTEDFRNNQENPQWVDEASHPDSVVQKIAEDNGIDYAQVPPAAEDAGSLPITIYAEKRMKNLGQESPGTPLYIANGKVVNLSELGQGGNLLEKATL